MLFRSKGRTARRKLAGQARVAASLPAGAAVVEVIANLEPEIDRADSPADLMVVEAAAAASYWNAWAEIQVLWIGRDATRVPEHSGGGPRPSLDSRGARRAPPTRYSTTSTRFWKPRPA